MPLIQFCMHELQWNDMRDAAENACARATTSKVEKWMRRIVEAYSSDWIGTRLYDFYRRGAQRGAFERCRTNESPQLNIPILPPLVKDNTQ
jgi:hypothetical protein